MLIIVILNYLYLEHNMNVPMNIMFKSIKKILIKSKISRFEPNMNVNTIQIES